MKFPLNIKLRSLREQFDMTQKQVADALDIDRSTYSYYETGKTEPSLSTLSRIAKIFQVSTDYLLNPSLTLNESPVNPFPENDALLVLSGNEKAILLKLRQVNDHQRLEILDFIDHKIEEANEKAP